MYYNIEIYLGISTRLKKKAKDSVFLFTGIYLSTIDTFFDLPLNKTLRPDTTTIGIPTEINTRISRI